MRSSRQKSTLLLAFLGLVIIAAMLVLSTVQNGRYAAQGSEQAVHSVSLLYLDELAGRREQVVEDNLRDNIQVIRIAIGMMTADDLSDAAHLQAYQYRMRQLFSLDKFAFVDTEGLIYTSQGTQDNIHQYAFNYRALSQPEVSLLSPRSSDRKVVIAVPLEPHLTFAGKTLSVCFMEMDMPVMLQGVSMQSQDAGTTFCNLYTPDGYALSNTVLGGQTQEENLFAALEEASFDPDTTLQQIQADFSSGNRGVVSFAYKGIQQSLSYIPVTGTDWMLTYLIHESVISSQISSVTDGMVRRSLLQSALTAGVLLALFVLLYLQYDRSARAALERETAEAENRGKQQELEQRLALQDQLLEKERQKARQDQLITALAADYYGVYYIQLDQDEGVCYQPHAHTDKGPQAGEHFPFGQTIARYAQRYVLDAYREDFLRFVQPDAIRAALATQMVISFRYMVQRGGRDAYEMLRIAAVRPSEGAEEHAVQAVGVCFTDVDAETRQTMAHNQALSEALAAAEQASRAKSAFLSNMSHEIRTPMNAIIGLDALALNEKDLPEKTREYLTKIGTSAEHLLGLINDILDMSRIESGRVTLREEAFSFAHLLESVNTLLDTQCRDKGLDYRCQLQGEVAERYLGDATKLREVLLNILSNAVKFTPAGGQIALQVEPVARFDRKTTLRFVISDTGIGMSPDFLPHLFDTFSQEDSSTTSKYGSSGLGMAITKNLVEMMNGTIHVESAKGKGTTFTVEVTLDDAPEAEAKDTFRQAAKDAPPQSQQKAELQGRHLLVAEDVEVNAEIIQMVLQMRGITCDLAANGRLAVEAFASHPAGTYDAILMDMRMPEMDGLEASRAIRAMDRPDAAVIPIIALTANAFDEDVQRSLQSGLNAHLSKPLDPDSLFNTLEELLPASPANTNTGEKN